MNRLVAAPTFALFSACALMAGQVEAQERVPIDMGQIESDETVKQVIVYGDDPCPTSDSGEITVCARKPEGERYRIPEPLRDIDRPQAEAWSNKIGDYERYNEQGLMGCSSVGPGGSLGCFHQFLDKAFRERKSSPEARYAQLIRVEREKRLARIDAESGADQKRVDDAEKAYQEQQMRKAGEDSVAASAIPAQN